MKKISLCLIIVLILMLILASGSGCKPGIRLPQDKSLGGSAQWLVITSWYCQLKSEASSASRDLGILRKGMVLKIVESTYSTDAADRGTLWFRIQNAGLSGWVSVRDVDTYTDENQARSAARKTE